MKAAYQKYMANVVNAAHQHFHEHVQRVRGSSAAPNGGQKAPPLRVEKGIKDAGG